jgi:hypothetical protein
MSCADFLFEVVEKAKRDFPTAFWFAVFLQKLGWKNGGNRTRSAISKLMNM